MESPFGAKRQKSKKEIEEMLKTGIGAQSDTETSPEIIINPNSDDTVVLVDDDGHSKILTELYEETLTKFARCNDKDTRVYFNEGLGIIRNNEFEFMSDHLLTYELTKKINFYGKGPQGSITPCAVLPNHIRDILLVHPNAPEYFPIVKTITGMPLFMPDGSIYADGGYIEELQVYQTHSTDIQLLGSLEEAKRTLMDPFKHFLFDTPGDCANAWAFLFTVLLRHQIEGNVPFFAIIAPRRGVGKGLLAKALYNIIQKGKLPVLDYPHRGSNKDESLKRTIGSALLMGRPVYNFDNIPKGAVINAPLLARIATEGTSSVKVLYRTKEQIVDVNSVFLFTGNNITFDEDIERRTQIINLRTDTEQPELRDLPNLRKIVKENKDQLINAAMTCLHFWHLAGRPASSQIKGSFEEWTAMVGGLLEFLGLEFRAVTTIQQELNPMKSLFMMIFNEYEELPWDVHDAAKFAFIEGDSGIMDEEVPDHIKKPLNWLGKQIVGYVNDIFEWTDDNGKDHKVKLVRIGNTKPARYRLLETVEKKEGDAIEDVPF